MNLAATLGFCLSLSLSLSTGQNSAPQDQTSTTQPQQSQPSQPAPANPSQTKPATHRPHKKKTPPNCSAAANPVTSTTADSPLPPCPTPKKVVHNGGSPEPTVQLTGDTTAQQAAQQRSIDQVTAATEANLKKVAGRELTSSQKDMVSQIKQFMDQSKEAVAAGDLERGHNLALKAQLLSDELVKP